MSVLRNLLSKLLELNWNEESTGTHWWFCMFPFIVELHNSSNSELNNQS